MKTIKNFFTKKLEPEQIEQIEQIIQNATMVKINALREEFSKHASTLLDLSAKWNPSDNNSDNNSEAGLLKLGFCYFAALKIEMPSLNFKYIEENDSKNRVVEYNRASKVIEIYTKHPYSKVFSFVYQKYIEALTRMMQLSILDNCRQHTEFVAKDYITPDVLKYMKKSHAKDGLQSDIFVKEVTDISKAIIAASTPMGPAKPPRQNATPKAKLERSQSY